LIEMLWSLLLDQVSGFDPVRDTIDIALVALGVYWLLILIRGTRAVQILVGLLLLIGTSLVSQAFELTTVEWILDNFLSSAVLIIIVLFQADIRRALARVGRGVFPSVAKQEETQLAEEVARAAQALAQKRVGALFVLERETHLSDLIEAGTPIDAAVKRDLLVSIFLPQSPLHDGAVVIQGGRLAQAGCILPLTLREDLPEGVGTRHRAAVGITEESDAVVIVVSEETQALSIVVGGVMARSLDGARLREVLRDVLAGGESERRVMAELAPRSAHVAEPRGATATEARQAGRA
jgi:diadenylate cyclase